MCILLYCIKLDLLHFVYSSLQPLRLKIGLAPLPVCQNRWELQPCLPLSYGSMSAATTGSGRQASSLRTRSREPLTQTATSGACKVAGSGSTTPTCGSSGVGSGNGIASRSIRPPDFNHRRRSRLRLQRPRARLRLQRPRARLRLQHLRHRLQRPRARLRLQHLRPRVRLRFLRPTKDDFFGQLGVRQA